MVQSLHSRTPVEVAVNDGIGSAKSTVMYCRFPTILNFEASSIEGTFGKAHLLAFRFIDLVTSGHLVVAIRIEPFRILPMARLQASGRVWTDNITNPWVRRRPHFL